MLRGAGLGEASGGPEQAARRSIERCRRGAASRVVTYIITVQCHYANVCGKALCERTYAYGGSCLHIIRGSPRRPAPAGSRQRWLYACECTHAALSLEARHWLLKRVAGGGGGRRAFRPGDHGETGAAAGPERR